MKTSQNKGGKADKKAPANLNKPEIRDNLDSRKNEEQDFKGDDMTNNNKETKKAKSKKK